SGKTTTCRMAERIANPHALFSISNIAGEEYQERCVVRVGRMFLSDTSQTAEPASADCTNSETVSRKCDQIVSDIFRGSNSECRNASKHFYFHFFPEGRVLIPVQHHRIRTLKVSLR